MRHRIIQTFTGPFAIIEDDDGIVTTSWLNAVSPKLLADSRMDSKLQPELTKLLTRYFQGEVVSFANAPLPGGSAFFRKCWKECRKIPRGQTISYGELARRAGSPDASRAAGQAMRSNPVPIVTPCHRVIGSTGRLHGFGGTCDAGSDSLRIKRALLDMEGWSPSPTNRRRSAQLVAV